MNAEDISDVIAQLMLQADPAPEPRLEHQLEALQGPLCYAPTIGRWIDEYDVLYLLSALTLEDKDFAETFPALVHTTKQQRQQLIAKIESHLETCLHCSLKRSYDSEFNERIMKELRAKRATTTASTSEFNARIMKAHHASHLFLCHSSADKKFVRKLASDLTELGVRVWLDEWELRVGDSLHGCIEVALGTSAFVGVVISPDSMNSRWCKEELNAALSREIRSGSKIVLPLLYRSVSLSPFLADRLYLDFRRRRLPALAELAAFIHDLDRRELAKLISQTRLRSFQDVRSLLMQLGWQNTRQVFVPHEEYEIMLKILRQAGAEIKSKEFELMERLSDGTYSVRTKVTM